MQLLFIFLLVLNAVLFAANVHMGFKNSWAWPSIYGAGATGFATGFLILIVFF